MQPRSKLLYCLISYDDVGNVALRMKSRLAPTLYGTHNPDVQAADIFQVILSNDLEYKGFVSHVLSVRSLGSTA